MATSILTAALKLSCDGVYSNDLDLSVAKDTVNYPLKQTFANGTGLNQINTFWSDRRTIAASSADDLDLAGGLTDAFGNVLTLTKVKGLIISAALANTNDVVIGGDASAAFYAFLGAANDTIILKPGAWFALCNPSAAGYAVTATTGDILQIANSSSGSSVTYDIVILGTK